MSSQISEKEAVRLMGLTQEQAREEAVSRGCTVIGGEPNDHRLAFDLTVKFNSDFADLVSRTFDIANTRHSSIAIVALLQGLSASCSSTAIMLLNMFFDMQNEDEVEASRDSRIMGMLANALYAYKLRAKKEEEAEETK